MSIAKTHENYSHDWHTPPEWIEWVSATLETDNWFDPCPAGWNPDLYLDGLSDEPWLFPCYVNHPGSRGSAQIWWAKLCAERACVVGSDPITWAPVIWCAFSVEQLRHMRPSPLEIDGWLVLPRQRVSYIWGGPTKIDKLGSVEREHDERAKCPGNWSVFWSSVEPAEPPIESIVIRTGVAQ